MRLQVEGARGLVVHTAPTMTKRCTHYHVAQQTCRANSTVQIHENHCHYSIANTEHAEARISQAHGMGRAGGVEPWAARQ